MHIRIITIMLLLYNLHHNCTYTSIVSITCKPFYQAIYNNNNINDDDDVCEDLRVNPPQYNGLPHSDIIIKTLTLIIHKFNIMGLSVRCLSPIYDISVFMSLHKFQMVFKKHVYL